VQVLLDRRTGVLRSRRFAGCEWAEDCHPAAMTDVLRVHAWKYVRGVREACAATPDDGGTRNIDSDTAVSRGTFRAALKAAGAVCLAVDEVVSGRVRPL
jgi:acetoin utilization deacetylase AcuC-like enzyme